MDLPTGEVLLLLDQVVTLFLPGPRAPGTPRPGAGAAEAARGAPLPVTPPPRRPGGDSSASSWGRLRACLGQGVSPPPGLPVPISQGDSEPLLGTWHGSYRPSGLRPGPGSDKIPPCDPRKRPNPSRRCQSPVPQRVAGDSGFGHPLRWGGEERPQLLRPVRASGPKWPGEGKGVEGDKSPGQALLLWRVSHARPEAGRTSLRDSERIHFPAPTAGDCQPMSFS